MRNLRLALIYGFLTSSAALILLIGVTQALELSADPSSLAAQINLFWG